MNATEPQSPAPLCLGCEERMRQAKAEGKIGAWICQACASRDKGPTLATIEHPAPWTWQMGSSAMDRGHLELWRLADANDKAVLQAADAGDTNLQCDSAVSRELIRLAPEMEALLRKYQWSSGGRETSECPDCGGPEPLPPRLPGGHDPTCDIGRILAAIGAARKTATDGSERR